MDTADSRSDLFDVLRQMGLRVWLSLAAILALGVAAVVVSETSARVTLEATADLGRIHEVRDLASEYLTLLLDAETSQRGYLLDREPAYLVPFDRALERYPTVATSLRAATQGDPPLLDRVVALDSLRLDKITEMRATILLAQQGEIVAAIRALRSDQGRELMSRIRARHVDLVQQLDISVGRRQADMAQAIRYTRIAFVVLGLLAFGLAMTTVRLLVNELRLNFERSSAAAAEQRRLESAVSERTERLSALTTHLHRVAEDERRQVAHELHDELGSLLTAAKMDLAWLEGRLGRQDPAVSAKLTALADDLDSAMSVKRRVTGNLRPALLEHFGLATALEAHYTEVCERAGLELGIDISQDATPVPETMAWPLFRIAQEALTNVIRHAHAQRVHLLLDEDADGWRLQIRDDGIGIDPGAGTRTGSLGVAGMRHRVEALGGRFSIGAAPGGGSLVDIRVPRPVSAPVAMADA